ncbi:hypothetical protein [Corallococcus sicarius]|uniref:Uncharacterized protein n=1 Tax=Corallococcus sicarius TaxID=2316726 RepID=A0A3A8NED9_9BACT|nr:hypothetical protein [Corallococcus sicarius]RKH42373.1 hypothetical protein D7X12_15800 [Corallococcus sicarius]
MISNIAVTVSELAVQNPLIALVFLLSCILLMRERMISKAWDMMLTKTMAPPPENHRKRKRK